MECSPRRRWLAFGALMLGLFTIIAAATSVNTAIPVLSGDLHADLTQQEWLVDSYFITLTVCMTTFGRLGDLFGRKWMFVTGGVLFAVGSVACALSRDINYLIAFRAMTALGPAMMMPSTLSLITDLFPPEERGFPLGLWGSMVGVATGVGPTLGGFLVSDVSWPWVFWVNVPLALVAVVLVAILLPSPRRRGHRPSLDPPGIVLNAGFVLCLSYALLEGHTHGWRSPLILGLFVAGALLLVLFVVREMTSREPMLDLNLFRQPAFSAGIVVTMTLSFGLLGVFFFVPQFLQYGPPHYAALESGLTLLPLSIAMFFAGPVGGFLADRVRPHRPIIVAMLLFSGGTFWLAHLSLSTSWQALIPPFVIIGIGLGVASANINTAVMAAVPREIAGAAAGVIATIRQFGSVLGIALLGVVLQERQSYLLAHHRPGPIAFTDAINDTFLVCAGVLLAGALTAFMVRQRRGTSEARRPRGSAAALERASERAGD